MRIPRTTLWQVFFVLAFFLGHVSPVCAFITGKTQYLEICSSDGTLRTIAVSEAFDPLSEGKQKSVKTKECAVCVFQAQLSKNTDALYDAPLMNSVDAPVFSAGAIVSTSFKYAQAQPRAPPALS
jgi:hypothetical protein